MVNIVIADSKSAQKTAQKISLDEWAIAPPSDRLEWVNGNLIEKTGMTLQHSRVQGRVVRLWGNHIEVSGCGGEVYTDVPCCTLEQGKGVDLMLPTLLLIC